MKHEFKGIICAIPILSAASLICLSLASFQQVGATVSDDVASTIMGGSCAGIKAWRCQIGECVGALYNQQGTDNPNQKLDGPAVYNCVSGTTSCGMAQGWVGCTNP